jgi:hypothetical protein
VTATAHAEPVVGSQLLECRGIEKRYGGVHALKGVDLTLTPGLGRASPRWSRSSWGLSGRTEGRCASVGRS